VLLASVTLNLISVSPNTECVVSLTVVTVPEVVCNSESSESVLYQKAGVEARDLRWEAHQYAKWRYPWLHGVLETRERS
jgi:hypothetical protein